MAVATRASEEIKKDILDQLYWDSRVSAADVEVDVTDGMVRLLGMVPTYSARRAAQEDAWQVDGVKAVDNRLYVEHPEGVPAPGDEQIRGSILDAVRGEADLEGADVDASVSGGWATLRGTVDAYWKKLLAEELASTRAGVRGVTSELAVVPSGTYEDKLIAESIIDALERNLQVAVGAIDVRVNGGKVTLSGNVPSLHAFRAAQATAEYTPGVVGVANDLVIR